MNKILSTLSILIYTAYSQSCGNNHAVSTMISFSIHGASVNDLIGSTAFNDVVKGASAAFTQSSNQRVGVIAFGGINTSPFTTSTTLRSLSDGDGSDVATAIDGATFDYANNYANVAQAAMTAANTALSGQSGRQKYHVIFSATLPLANGKGINTQPSDIDDICAAARISKAAGIQTYVVLVGTEGENVFPSFWSCAVEDQDNDIVIIDPTTPSYTAITALLCKTGGVDIQITEVKPRNDGTSYNAFIEVLNRGASASIQAGWSGSYGSSVTVPTGGYLVASTGGTNYGSYPSTLPTVAPADVWTATASATANSVTGTDTVVHSATASIYAQSAITGRSFELRAIGYNNDYPANWRTGCYNIDGTPGSAPVVNGDGTPGECVQVTNSCPQTITSDNGCTQNDAPVQDPQCNAGSGQAYCNCGLDYLEDTDTCIPPVPVISAGGCQANVAKWWDGNDYIFYQFERVEYDGNVEYSITDNNGANTAKTAIPVSGLGTGSFQSTLGSGGTFSVDVAATSFSSQGGGGVAASTVTLSCGKALTEQPTNAPSMGPTGRPSMAPSEAPTMKPTFDAPGVYMSAVKPRGDCGGGEARSCCSPFGPQYDTVTNTGGTLPSGETECTLFDNNEEIELLEADGNFIQKDFEFNLYPEGYVDHTTVTVKIYAYGLINKTDFDNLTFAGNYKIDGLIPTIFDSSNALEWGPDARRRRRLQNGTNQNSYTYGNKLNIGVTPPGDSSSWTGIVDIPQGSSSAKLTMNISLADLKCNEGDFDCTTYADCQEWSLAFAIVALNCQNQTISPTGECKPLFPSTRFFSIRRSDALCAINFGIGNQEDELPDWFWWVLIALIVFLLILAWLVYRFWWKQKKTASELGDAEDELDQQIADNEAGFGKELDVGDVAFNPMATGVPGMNRPADAFGNELHQRQLQQQNDMVDVQAEIFQVRQDYGQVNTGNRHHQQGGGY